MTMDFSLVTFFSMPGKLRKCLMSTAVTLMRMDLIFLTFFTVSGKFRNVTLMRTDFILTFFSVSGKLNFVVYSEG